MIRATVLGALALLGCIELRERAAAALVRVADAVRGSGCPECAVLRRYHRDAEARAAAGREALRELTEEARR